MNFDIKSLLLYTGKVHGTYEVASGKGGLADGFTEYDHHENIEAIPSTFPEGHSIHWITLGFHMNHYRNVRESRHRGVKNTLASDIAPLLYIRFIYLRM